MCGEAKTGFRVAYVRAMKLSRLYKYAFYAIDAQRKLSHLQDARATSPWPHDISQRGRPCSELALRQSHGKECVEWPPSPR